MLLLPGIYLFPFELFTYYICFIAKKLLLIYKLQLLKWIELFVRHPDSEIRDDCADVLENVLCNLSSCLLKWGKLFCNTVKNTLINVLVFVEFGILDVRCLQNS